MYKIAHISDSHISFKDEDERGRKLVELLNDIKERECDHIVFTGDLVENPHEQDLLFVREIFSHFGLLDSGKLSVVPGNHDIFGGAIRGVDFFRFIKSCSEVNYENKIDLFIDSFKETFPSNNSFPYLKIIDNVTLIGINSIDLWSIDKNPEGSNGRINNDDYEKLRNILSSEEIQDKFKLILIHHHFNKPEFNEEYPAHSLWLKVVNWKMKLYGKKKLLKLFKKHNVNLVLYGHTHINEISFIKKISFLNSSACIFPITDDQIRKYNIINIPSEIDTEKNITIETIIVG
ncbi:MAG: metallophosphoesterase [Bacteroidota bacterium]|nr:metallophosphoesterase [Bacteroidota bacterium]